MGYVTNVAQVDRQIIDHMVSEVFCCWSILLKIRRMYVFS